MSAGPSEAIKERLVQAARKMGIDEDKPNEEKSKKKAGMCSPPVLSSGDGLADLPPLDQALPAMHTVVVLLSLALRVFFFGTGLGSDLFVHHLSTRRTETHRCIGVPMI